MIRAFAAVILLLVCITVAGCFGGSPNSSSQIAARTTAQESSDKVQKAAVDSETQAVIDAATAVIKSGGANPDQLEEALFRRAEAYAKSGQPDLAIADLDQVLQGGAEIERAQTLKAELLKSQGK